MGRVKTEENDLEQKRWMFNIIHSVIENQYDEIEAAKQEWSVRFREAYPETIKNNRNKYLATIAFIITSLFSLNAFIKASLLENISVWIIIGLSLYALIMFFLNHRLWQRMVNRTNAIHIGYLSPQYRLLALEGYIYSLSMHPGKFSIEELDNLYEFVILAQLNRIELVKACREAREDPMFIKDKDFLDAAIVGLEMAMREVSNEFKNKFSKDHPIIGSMYGLVEPVIKEYGTNSEKTPTKVRGVHQGNRPTFV